MEQKAGLERYGWLAAIAVVYLYVFPYFPRIHSANELPRAYLVKAIVADHTFAIDRGVAAWGTTADVSPSGGHQYSNKAPGASLLAVPAYAAVRAVAGEPSLAATIWICRTVAGIAPMLAFLWLLWGFLVRFAPDPNIRRLVLLAYALGSLAMTYSILFYSHQLGAICAASAWILALDVVDGRRGRLAMAAAGFLAGAAPLADYQAAFAVVPVAVHVLARLWSRRTVGSSSIPHRGEDRLHEVRVDEGHRDAVRGDAVRGDAVREDAGRGDIPRAEVVRGDVARVSDRRSMLPPIVWAAAGVALPIASLLVYHKVCFGSPWRTGYDASTTFAVFHQHGFLGITALRWQAFVGSTVRLDNGLLALSPWWLLAVPGTAALWRGGQRGVAAVGGAVTVIYVLFISSINFWRGGWEVGPRYIAAMLPFLLPAVAAQLQAWSGRRVRLGVAAGLVGVGVAVYVLSSGTFPYWPDSVAHPLYDVTFRLLGDNLVAPSVGSAAGVGGIAGIAPYLAIGLGVPAWAIARVAGGRGLAIAAAVTVAILVGYGRSPHGEPRADAAYRTVRAAVVDL
ncbi:MAG TPA: hypothetical protein VLM79_38870 [Kofleriaceae bacterium]|nr:hypothetical protein [Kofleriaceae bacterium]